MNDTIPDIAAQRRDRDIRHAGECAARAREQARDLAAQGHHTTAALYRGIAASHEAEARRLRCLRRLRESTR